MSGIEIKAGEYWCKFDTMVWPIPSERLLKIYFDLSQGKLYASNGQQVAASVISAYMHMINGKDAKLRKIMPKLRQASRMMFEAEKKNHGIILAEGGSDE